MPSIVFQCILVSRSSGNSLSGSSINQRLPIIPRKPTGIHSNEKPIPKEVPDGKDPGVGNSCSKKHWSAEIDFLLTAETFCISWVQENGYDKQ